MRDYKFTLEDVLLLISPNKDIDDKIIISEDGDEDTWTIIPANSKLLWVPENLNRKVSSINIYDEMLQIWLAPEKHNT